MTTTYYLLLGLDADDHHYTLGEEYEGGTWWWVPGHNTKDGVRFSSPTGIERQIRMQTIPVQKVRPIVTYRIVRIEEHETVLDWRHDVVPERP